MILCPVTKPFGIELTKLVPSWDEFHRSVWSASSLRKHARNVISPRSLFRPLAFRGHCLRLSLFAFLTPAGSRMHVLCVCIMPTTTLLGYNITLEASWIHAGMQTIRHRSPPPPTRLIFLSFSYSLARHFYRFYGCEKREQAKNRGTNCDS